MPTLVLLVDQSETDEDKASLENILGSKCKVEYLRSESKGLVNARNLALQHLHGKYDVVHFLDDDVVVDSPYFAEIMTTFEGQPEIVGVGGLTRMRQQYSPHPMFVKFGVHAATPGVVLANGFSSGSDHTDTMHTVQWLPGCSMSFRLRLIHGCAFDPSRSKYPIGEDVDFGLKASSRGPLLHNPKAQLVHNMSPANRVSAARWAEEDVYNRWKLAADFPNVVSKRKVISGSLLFGGLYILGGVAQLNSSKIAIGVSTFKGLAKVRTIKW